jgi:tRNA-splicing ligase RtcB
MKTIYNPETQRVPIKLWLEDIEEGAMAQAINLSNLPFVFKHVAIMPDSHQGYGMPIGGVLATEGVVIPNAVGVDIGCGMCSIKTSLTSIDTETIKKILGGSKEYHGGIRSAIPVGFNHHSKKQDESLMPIGFEQPYTLNTFCPIVYTQYESALKQLGTLGGGNHFIELQKGNDGYIYVMIHSGSRNLGFKVAEFYNKLAIEVNAKWYTIVPKEHQLAFLPMNSPEGLAYLREMNYCVEFALANRKLMMENIKKCIVEVIPDVTFEPMINIAHNYATMENHFGKNVMVHRKGATLARQDTIGIIPGSQGTKSYIVRGLGNEESFTSCSHGAGRKMSRTKAQNELNLEDEIKKLDEQGIIHGIRNKNDLDEASGAYKDIDVVMSNQKDLVEIVTELTPLAVIKG